MIRPFVSSNQASIIRENARDKRPVAAKALFLPRVPGFDGQIGSEPRARGTFQLLI
jgi:hypothetical protein